MLTNVPNQSTSTNNNWIPDSGASFHVTGASQNIQKIEPFEGPDQIFIGNGQGLPISLSLCLFIYCMCLISLKTLLVSASLLKIIESFLSNILIFVL